MIYKQWIPTVLAAFIFTACKKDKDPIIVVPPSTGSDVQFNGLAGTEAGSSAGNSVYLDLSSNKMTNVQRSGWDLAFYCGPEFRVFLNHTTSAGAKLLMKNDLTAVDATDTIGLTLAVNQMAPSPSDFDYFDDLDGSLEGTVIPEISATDANNKVIIINRGTGGGIAARPWIKLRVLRNGSDGYTVQYATIQSTTFRTVIVSKDADYHVKLFSFDTGTTLTVGQPEKSKWDLAWSYSLFQTNFGSMVPYNFSDLITVNVLSNVQVKEKIYADEATATAAYSAFNKDSVNLPANTVASGRWTIGSNWRSTQPATGARKDRFYIIKDTNGNYYKFKCKAMGVGTDGGTRGKPEFKYDLIAM